MYRKTIQERLEELQSSAQGLSNEQRRLRRKEYGYNEILDEDSPSFMTIFFEQFRQVGLWILLITAGFTAFLGQYVQGGILLFIGLFNLCLQTFQLYRAEKAMAALRNMTSPTCLVLEEGQVVELETRDLVPGDVVLLESGNIVPADGRLIESNHLQIDESLLTGEARSVEKDINFAPRENIPLGERVNMAYASTIVNSGKGILLVTNTGMDTEIGKIAFMLYKDEDRDIPMRKEISRFGRYLGMLSALLVLGLGAYGFFVLDMALETVVLTGLSLLISMLPFALTAIASITLGLGVYRLAKKNALLRRVQSVEVLGAVSVICTDKSGTLTENRLKVTDLSTGSDDDETWMKKICLLCNDVHIGESSYGDPTEVALMEFALDGEFDLNELREQYPRLVELAFDSSRKRMTTLHQDGDRKLLLSKGGLDEILEISSSYRVDGETYPLEDEVREGIMESNASYASEGKRVLAMAYRYGDELREEDMIFLGLIALVDPPLEGVTESVKLCKRAGIRPVMITGDHLITASQVAKEVGILTEGYEAITGASLDELSEEEFKERVEDYSVYARVTPQQRLRILDAWKEKGHMVAMTGKSVSDTASLRRADLGVALDKKATAVSKSAADLLIRDDNFATLVGSVEAGRMIFSNLRRSLRYLLSTNLSLLILLFAGIFLRKELPLLPLQILWISLVTSALPTLALVVEPKERNIMMANPKSMKESVLSRKGFLLSLLEAGLMALSGLLVYFFGKNLYPQEAQTMAFMTMGFIHLFQAMNLRNSQSILGKDFFSNKSFFPTVLLSVICLVITVILGPLQGLFGTKMLNLQQWGMVLIASVAILLFSELRKIFLKE